MRTHTDLHKFHEKVAFQLNDTHPTVAVAELMRVLMDDYDLSWDEAWEITCKTCAYTNHTIMSEALEKWPIELFSRLLPRIYQIVEEINRRFVLRIQQMYPGNQEKIRKMAIIYDGQVKMAHLAIVGGHSVNGVARLHTEILEKQELRDFYEMMPEKFNNKTNGITQRRFLLHANPLLADWVTDHVGDEWITDLPALSKLRIYADDEKAQQEFMNIKYQNKVRLAKYIREHNGIEVDPRSIFDVQVKRLHEYKRQLMNILHIMYLYNELKDHPDMDFYPRTFIFGAKAAAGYRNAKLTIKLINSVADVINNDPVVDGRIKVVFIENYRVSNAEWIFAAADVSEQISTASKELRYRQHEVHVKRCADPGHDGRCERRDRRRGRQGKCLHLRPERRAGYPVRKLRRLQPDGYLQQRSGYPPCADAADQRDLFPSGSRAVQTAV